jgi:hypothetical protein
MENVKEIFKDFVIIDCAVHSKDHFYFIASHTYYLDEQDQKSSKTIDERREAVRIAAFFPNKPDGEKWSFRTIRHIEFMKCAASEFPASQLIAVSIDGQVFVVGSGVADFEEHIPEHRYGPLRGLVNDVVCIDGIVYAVQGNRGLCNRMRPNMWASLCTELPVSTSRQRRKIEGFRCVTGTSASNIYAGGGRGDLWHFDGKTWDQLNFPSNVMIETICCAGERDIYVGCQSGIVYRGHGNAWKKITDGSLGLSCKSMVAYQGWIWCSSNYGIWIIRGNSIEKADVPSNIYMKAGILATKGDILMVAGLNGAAYWDGSRWYDILNLS